MNRGGVRREGSIGQEREVETLQSVTPYVVSEKKEGWMDCLYIAKH